MLEELEFFSLGGKLRLKRVNSKDKKIVIIAWAYMIQ